MLLKAENIRKSFGATRALDGVSLSLEAGEVHALVGENGAGKSTLFKICAGAVLKDEGHLTLDDQPYEPRSLRDAQDAGVALVFQEITIIPSISIAENIYIDRLHEFSGPLGFTGWRKLRASAQTMLDALEAGISVNQPLSQLNLGQLKIIEIARALAYDPKVLLLDETTAFLNTQEMDALFAVIAKLKERRLAVGYISHHLDEIERIADSITILRDGQHIGDYAVGELTTKQIEARMVGREIGEQIYPTAQPANGKHPNEVILKLEQVADRERLEPFDLELRRGEILGIGGLKGSGGEAIIRLIAGDVPLRQGQMWFAGVPYHPRNPSDAWARGVAYLPGDRTGEGLIIDFTVRENLSMAVMPNRSGVLNRETERRLVEELITAIQIKASGANAPCNSLSGGNLQKVVLGKCIAPEPKVLLLNNPTRGIDVGARMQIYQIIRRLADAGLAVILLSEDLLELIGMSDRLIIMRKGIISQEFAGLDTIPAEKDIISHMI
ncbi:MAG: sugar ABC transporter ATP-binding protein [Chloroflexi bacterium]|nr:sugar ABC transporter ATP-binding protein [Chloroflexota bacterium]